MRYVAYWCLLIIPGACALAHHSTLGFYDQAQTIEIEGTLRSLSMGNPHVRFVVTVTEADGSTVDWDVESSAVSVLRTRGLDQDFMRPGDHIRVSGAPSRRGRSEMNGRTVLLDDGVEVILALSGSPYFTALDSAATLLEPVYTQGAAELARANADGIFRVWTAVYGDPDSFPMFKGDYPLTAEAARARDEWNTQDEETLRCWKKGMPLLMITPVPIEFTRDGNDIVVLFEEDDARRRVYMNATDANRPETASLLGYSVGRWEGETLVVETTGIDFPWLDDRGAPQSDAVHLLERFTVNAAQDRLEYHITITDPVTLSRPLELARYWVWRPEVVVGRWDCQDRE